MTEYPDVFLRAIALVCAEQRDARIVGHYDAARVCKGVTLTYSVPILLPLPAQIAAVLAGIPDGWGPPQLTVEHRDGALVPRVEIRVYLAATG